MKHVHEGDILWPVAKVCTDEIEDGSLNNPRVVDGAAADYGDTVPARTASTSNGLVHYIVKDKGVCVRLKWMSDTLKKEAYVYQFDSPCKGNTSFEFVLSEIAL